MTAPDFIFDNYGAAYQLRIASARDLACLGELDEVFWMATSAPVDQLACGPLLLKRLDADGNGRILSMELRRAVRWLLDVLSSYEGVDKRLDVLQLDWLDTATEEGRRMRGVAQLVLTNLGRGGAVELTRQQVADRQAILAQGAHNGDGIVPLDAIEDVDLQALAADIAATMGTVTDRNGAPGINQPLVDGFLENAQALLEWHEEVAAADNEEELLPFGAGTAAKYDTLAAIAPAIDRFFAQCDVAALNRVLGRSCEAAQCPGDVYGGIDAARSYLEDAPLAMPCPEGVLPLREGVNPAYASALAALVDEVLVFALGRPFRGEALSAEDWARVKGVFSAYERWLQAKRGGQVERVGLERLREYVDGEAPARLCALIEADLAAGPEAQALDDLEYLLVLQQNVLDLCNNFVSFPYLYDPSCRAMFECGRLVLDGHVFNMNFRISNADAHSAGAERSGIFLLYSEVTGAAGVQPFYMVTPVTRGRVSQLAPGKRGVLFDKAGAEWDVRVVKVVVNPVNLRQAMLAPFKRLGAQLASTAERITAGAEEQLHGQVSQATASLESGVKEGVAAAGRGPDAQVATAPAAAGTTPESQAASAPAAAGTTPESQAVSAPAAPAGGAPGFGRVRDFVLAGSVAVSALGASFAFVAKTLNDLGTRWWLILAAVGAGLVFVLVPSVLIAYLRLRRRNLSAILEASGWAINAPMRLTWSLSRLIVQKPPHPKSFRLISKDLARAFSRTLRSKE